MTSRLKPILFILMDCVLVNCAILFVFWNHDSSQLLSDWSGNFSQFMTLIINTMVFVSCFYVGGLYKRMWQYVGIGEMLSILKAVTGGSLIYALSYRLINSFPLPWNVWVELWITVLFFIGSSRMGRLLLQEISYQRMEGNRLKPALIIGAGDAGALVAKTLLYNKLGLQPMGFIDDNPAKRGLRLYNIPILGSRQDIPRISQEYAIEEIVIAIPSASPETIRELISLCRKTPARLKIVPGVVKLLKGQLPPDQIRDIQVEDLLQREPVHVDLEEIASYLFRKVVLVTGAGGSIGSELCRQVLEFNPQLLVILGHGENSIYDLHQELAKNYPDVPVAAEIGDVRDFQRMEAVFYKHRPEVVFHAAAHKHVPLMEEVPEEAFQNNVLGTRNVTRAAELVGTRVFVFISTDKAVNPVSVMGASKKLAELIVNRMNELSPTKYVVVRFGNVLGSRGSVLPLFKRQIAAGGPVTVTHPEMFRYFMTIPEAVQLVIIAGSMAAGGETFVLDMGEPVKILDLAKALIDISGQKENIKIVFTGTRPGEKLSEELFTTEEGAMVTKHKRIYITQTRHEVSVLVEDLITRKDTSFPSSAIEALDILKQVMGH